MSKGYLNAHLRVHDKEALEEARRRSGETIMQGNGKALVRQPEPDRREGGAQGLAIVAESESIGVAHAHCRSKADTRARAVREITSDTPFIFAGGV